MATYSVRRLLSASVPAPRARSLWLRETRWIKSNGALEAAEIRSIVTKFAVCLGIPDAASTYCRSSGIDATFNQVRHHYAHMPVPGW